MSCSQAVCSRSLREDRHHQQRKHCHSECGLWEGIQYCIETALPVIMVINDFIMIAQLINAGTQWQNAMVTMYDSFVLTYF